MVGFIFGTIIGFVGGVTGIVAWSFHKLKENNAELKRRTLVREAKRAIRIDRANREDPEFKWNKDGTRVMGFYNKAV